MEPVPIEYRNYTFFRYAGQSVIGSVSFGGYHADGKGVPTKRVLEWYALIYVVRGRAKYEDANGMTATLGRGDLLLLFPGVEHTYTPLDGEPWSEIWFTFGGPVFDVWRERGLLDPAHPVRKLLPVDYWHRRLEVLLEMGQRLSGRSALEQVCALQLVLAEALGSDAEPDATDEQHLWLAQASSCLDVETLEDAPSLEAVSAKMGMSYDRFRRRFRALSGITPRHFRIARIMDRACRLMQERRITNRELSEFFGFCSEFHFSRRFKQVVGITPKGFRQRVGMSLADENSVPIESAEPVPAAPPRRNRSPRGKSVSAAGN